MADEASVPGRAFVSYSRKDERLVTPLVRLLRTLHREIFQDIDSIEPGRRWEEELDAALRTSATFLVFWCRHAASSTWVRQECELAIESHLRAVVPVMLDQTPLSGGLEHYEAIDLRSLGVHHRSRVWVGVIALVLVLILLLGALMAFSQRAAVAGAVKPQARSALAVTLALVVLAVVAVFVTSALVWRSWHRRQARRRAADQIASSVQSLLGGVG